MMRMPRRGVNVAAPAIAALCLGSTFVLGQRPIRDPRAALEGLWNSATVTPLERPTTLQDRAFFTEAEAAAFERDAIARNEEPPPDAPRTGTGTYNTFYREFGTRTVRTRRTSIVID